jgi:hypothetical protein
MMKGPILKAFITTAYRIGEERRSPPGYAGVRSQKREGQTMRDIFICHAGEDKDEIVRPMAEAFSQAGISCWYDEAEIRLGDSIVQKVRKAIRTT